MATAAREPEPRYAHLRSTLGPELLERVRKTKVLVVGAGGIGCELLKNLVLTGFEDIETIDLDTIDVSNLNRQFLFRQRHVGASKAMVARGAVSAFNPLAKVKAHHGNIKHDKFGLGYFKRFALVFNALDNIGARRHVNRLCLANKLPLIESGTTGYLGQVQPMRKGDTECYECVAHDPPKAHPICTIRSTPSKPVHCIVWAKELYKLMFGASEQSMLYEAPELSGGTKEEKGDNGNGSANANGDGNGDGDANSNSNSSTFMPLLEPPARVKAAKEGKDPAPAAEILSWAAALFGAVFEDEVVQKIGMGIYKGAEKPPAPILKATFSDAAAALAEPDTSTRTMGSAWRQATWSPEEAAREMLACVADIWGDAATAANVGALDFDKDDKISMRFVAAAAALRAAVFSIPVQSYHDAKGIAGNIIPAIATTNAIVAGLQVLEGLKILNNADEDKTLRDTNKFVWVSRVPAAGNRYIYPSTLKEPNPKCYVCSQGHQTVHIDLEETSLDAFVAKVLKARLGIIEPNIVMGDSIVYEEGEDADAALAKANLGKKLTELPGVTAASGGGMTVDDYRQDLTLKVLLVHRSASAWDEEKFPDGFFIGDKLPEGADGENGGDGDGDGDGDCEVQDASPPAGAQAQVGGKRKREGDAGDAAPSKR